MRFIRVQLYLINTLHVTHKQKNVCKNNASQLGKYRTTERQKRTKNIAIVMFSEGISSSMKGCKFNFEGAKHICFTFPKFNFGNHKMDIR